MADEKSDLVQRAKLAEQVCVCLIFVSFTVILMIIEFLNFWKHLQAERYDDMADAMKKVAEFGGELSNEVQFVVFLLCSFVCWCQTELGVYVYVCLFPINLFIFFFVGA